MMHVELVRVLSREWPEKETAWWDNVVRLAEVPYERVDEGGSLQNAIMYGVHVGRFSGRQLDWGATIAYLTPEQMLTLLGDVPPAREGQVHWERKCIGRTAAAEPEN